MEDEAILLDRDHERVHQLNAVATFILQCCDGRRTEADIAREVWTRYDVSEQAAGTDASALLARMRALKILV